MLVRSELGRGEVIAEVSAPSRQTPDKTLLRIRLPDGWQHIRAAVNEEQLPIDNKGTVDISRFQGKFTLRFTVRRAG